MRTYIIILSEIKDQVSDKKFSDFINENKFDYWRYTAFNFILLTPDTVSTNQLVAKITESYGVNFQCVLEININDVGGLFPTNNPNIITPFQWFHEIKKPSFIPRWEKEKETNSDTKQNH
jgi:hypothetical protein